MKWKNKHAWHKWFAWYPINIDGTSYWFETVNRRKATIGWWWIYSVERECIK